MRRGLGEQPRRRRPGRATLSAVSLDVKCPRCGAKVAAGDINLARMAAKCASCDALFAVSPHASGRAKVPRPRSIVVESESETRSEDASYRDRAAVRGTLRLRRSWWKPVAIFQAVFCVFWIGFLVNWYAIALSADEPPIVMLVFPLLHVAVGVGLAYYTIALFLNRTLVSVDGDRLRIEIGPIPWRGAAELPTRGITQLYRVRRAGRKGRVSYTLAALVEREPQELVRGLTYDEVRYLEQEIEAHLAIADDPSMNDE